MMLVARLRHCINKHQTNRETYVQPLTYGFNTQIHRTIITSPFSLVRSQVQPGTLETEKTKTLKENRTTAAVLTKLEVMENLRLLKRQAKRSSQKARKSYERYLNKKVRQLPNLKTGDWIYIGRPLTLKKE